MNSETPERPWTPGPWEPDDRLWSILVTRNGQRYRILEVYSWMGVDEANANTPLIAAAPDLFEALEIYVKRGHSDFCAASFDRRRRCSCGYTDGRAALRKALPGWEPGK